MYKDYCQMGLNIFLYNMKHRDMFENDQELLAHAVKQVAKWNPGELKGFLRECLEVLSENMEVLENSENLLCSL